MEKIYEELEVIYVKADEVDQIVFTAEQNQLGSDINNDRSLIASTEVLHNVKSLPLEEHISASQWLSGIHSGSDSEDSGSFGYSSDSDLSDTEQVLFDHSNAKDINEMQEDIFSQDVHQNIGIQTYLRSQNPAKDETFNSLLHVDHFDYFPVDEGYSADMFFEVFSGRQKKASTNSMTQISLLNDKELFDILASLPDEFTARKQRIMEIYKNEFPQWHFQLKEGFNILLYGFGSKKGILDEFMKSELESEFSIIVKGYFPALSLKNLLTMIYINILHYEDAPSDPIQLCNLIREHYEESKEKHKPSVYLLVHSIDGVALRSKKAQTILSLLASIPNIHIIASIDHIKSAYMWDYYISGKYNFVSHHACTYEHYFSETKYDTNPFISKASKGVLGIRAAMMVLEGLTSRAHQVFSLLAEEQLQSNTGFSFKMLLRKCREKFILTNEHHLKGYLTEFKEHKLVKIVNNKKEGTELYSICMPAAFISKILTEIQNGALGQ